MPRPSRTYTFGASSKAAYYLISACYLKTFLKDLEILHLSKGRKWFEPFHIRIILFPIQGFGKEISKTIAELYRSFSRAASLVPTAEANVCCEELCTMILSVEGDWSSKVRTFL